MGGLYVVEQDDIFQFHRVAYHAVCTHQCAAPDKGTVAHLCFRADDAGGAQIGRGSHGGGFVHPHLGCHLVIALQGGTNGQNEVLYARQSLPGIGELCQILPGDGVV